MCTHKLCAVEQSKAFFRLQFNCRQPQRFHNVNDCLICPRYITSPSPIKGRTRCQRARSPKLQRAQFPDHRVNSVIEQVDEALNRFHLNTRATCGQALDFQQSISLTISSETGSPIPQACDITRFLLELCQVVVRNGTIAKRSEAGGYAIYGFCLPAIFLSR
jgi:hypothetical protein